MDIKKHLGVYSKNIYVLMAVAATCTIGSQSEKSDAMFRSILSKATSTVSGILGSASRGVRSTASGVRTGLGTPSNPGSTDTAPGSVAYDQTPGGSPVFVTNPWGRRMHYGETDAKVLSKEIGPNIEPNTKYNLYYDYDNKPVITTTNLGNTLRILAHGEIRVGTYEDPKTGNKSKRIVLVNPWWISGADIIKASHSPDSKYSNDKGGSKVSVTLPSGSSFSSSDITLDNRNGSAGVHGISDDDLRLGKALLKPTVVVEKGGINGTIVTDNRGNPLKHIVPVVTEDKSSSTIPDAPPLPVDSKSYSVQKSEVRADDLKAQHENLTKTIVKNKTGYGNTRYETSNGEEIAFPGIVSNRMGLDLSDPESLMVFSSSTTSSTTPDTDISGSSGVSTPSTKSSILSSVSKGSDQLESNEDEFLLVRAEQVNVSDLDDFDSTGGDSPPRAQVRILHGGGRSIRSSWE